MKKAKFGRKLSRGQGARKALFRQLIKALVEHGSIVTTRAKAKSIQKDVDKLVNLAKNDTVAARRRIYSRLGNDRKTTDRFFADIAPKFSSKKGGYTRTINLPRRKGDLAEMVRFEFIEKIGSKLDTKVKKLVKNAKTGEKKGRLGSLRKRIGREKSNDK